MNKVFSIFLAVAFILTTGGSALADTIAGADAVAGANAIIDNTGAEANTQSEATAEQSVSFEQTFEASKPIRGFTPQGEYHVLPGFISYSGPRNPGPSFRYAFELIEYQDTYTVDGLIALVGPKTLKAYQDKYGQIKGLDKPNDAVKFFVRVIKKNGNGNKVEIAKYEPKGKLQQKKFITVNSLKGLTSVECVGLVGLLTHEVGGNVAVVTMEGVKRTAESSSWGIGVAYTGSAMNADGNKCDTRGGGTGYARSKGGYTDNPYMSATALHDDGLKYEKS